MPLVNARILTRLCRRLWTAPAERSGDGAFERPKLLELILTSQSGVAASLCHRSPKSVVAHAVRGLHGNVRMRPFLGALGARGFVFFRVHGIDWPPAVLCV